MKNHYVKTSNHRAFMAAVNKVETSAPREARALVRPQGHKASRVKVPVDVSHNVVAESNCVTAMWGGEQLEAKEQSAIK